MEPLYKIPHQTNVQSQLGFRANYVPRGHFLNSDAQPQVGV